MLFLIVLRTVGGGDVRQIASLPTTIVVISEVELLGTSLFVHMDDVLAPNCTSIIIYTSPLHLMVSPDATNSLSFTLFLMERW